MKKRIKLFLTLLFAVFVMANVANADTRTLTFGDRAYAPGNWGSYYFAHFYKLDNDDAYCLQLNNSLKNGDTYTLYTDANLTERKRYIAAQIIKYIQTKSGYTAGEKAFITYLALNEHFKMPGYFAASYAEAKGYKDVLADIAEGTKLYNSLKMELCTGTNNGKCLNNNAFGLSVLSGKVEMNPGSSSEPNTWYSERMTVTGMLDKFGGTATKYTISVKGYGNDSLAGICIVPSNSNTCMTAVANGTYTYTLNSPSSSSFNFRVKLVGEANAGKSVTVSVRGENTATYSYVNVYKSKTSGTRQALAIPANRTVKRYVYRDLILNVPVSELKHTISARKYDNNKVSLEGADFEVRVYDKSLDSATIDDSTQQVTSVNGQPFPVKNSNGSSYFKWTSASIDKENDQWNDYQYCLVETKVPAGYVHPSGSERYTCVKPNAQSACYNKENQTVDAKYCQSATYVCPDGGNYEHGACTKTISILNTEQSNLFVDVTDNSEYTTDIYSCEGENFVLDTTGEHLTCRYIGEEDPAPEAPLPTVVGKSCRSDTDCIQVVGDGSNTRFYTCPSNYKLDPEEYGVCYNTLAVTGNKTTDSDNGIKCKVGDGTATTGDLDFCAAKLLTDEPEQFTEVNSTGVNLHFVRLNSQTGVRVCKKNITGDEELAGAKLKICESKPDKNGNCTLAKVDSYDDDGNKTKVDVSWISSKSSNDDSCGRVISGLETGKTYYLVEEIAPLGYKISTAVEFSLDEAGKLHVGGKESSTNELVINDDLSTFSISKSDMATTKELPGAKLKICLAGLDENGEYQMAVDNDGNCIVPLLHDESKAEWISSDEPHEVVGLPAGAYYLVESQAPLGYDVTESILFILNQDGTLSDKDGNLIGDGSKLVMHDKKIEQVPTGDILVGLVAFLGILGFAFGSYYYFDNNKNKNENKVSA